MLNQNPRQAEFVLGTCPHCQKVVRIPVTAVTSQSSSHVGCPICSHSFELASVLEETVPAVKVVDSAPVEPVNKKSDDQRPQRINAIDTPELFHSLSKESYEPITEKKNGRFVVPELLSKGNDKNKKKKKKRKSKRRRSSNDPDVAKSLAKLRETTASTSLEPTNGEPPVVETNVEIGQENSSDRSQSRKKGRGGSRKKASSRTRTSGGIMGLPSRITRMFRNNLTSDAEADSSRGDIMMLSFGALIAIPLLHLMMWWFTGFDPLGLAKPVSRVAPFIVPNSLQDPNNQLLAVPAEPSQQSLDNDAGFFESSPNASTRPVDGRLPKPNLDPSSVHVDEVN